MGYRLNRLDKPVFIAMSKPLLTEFGIHHILESCVDGVINSESLMLPFGKISFLSDSIEFRYRN